MSQPESHSLTLPPLVPVRFWLFCRPDPRQRVSSDTFKAWTRSWANTHVDPEFRLVTQTFLDGAVQIEMTPVDQMPADAIPHLRLLVTDGAALSRIESATHVVVIDGWDTAAGPRPVLWACLAAALALAARLGGVLIDVHTPEPVPAQCEFSAFHFAKMPRALRFLQIATSFEEDRMDRLAVTTTAGLARFGLPEIQILDVPLLDIEGLARVLLGIGQVLIALATQYGRPPDQWTSEIPLPLELALTAPYLQIANGLPPETPTTGFGQQARVRLELQPARRGDPEERFLTLRPPSDYSGEYGEWLFGLVNTFYDTQIQEPPRPTVSASGQTMEEARAQALRELPEVRRQFLAGELTGGLLLVKARFPFDGGNEYMWLHIRSWDKETLTGELTNMPDHRTDLRQGQILTVPEREIWDWRTYAADGTPRGGYTDLVPVAPRPSEPSNEFAQEERRVRGLFREWIGALAAGTPKRGWFGLRRPAAPSENLELLRRVAEEGRYGMAFLLMANAVLFQPGKTDAPGLALLTFEEGAFDFAFMLALIDRLGDLSTQPSRTPAEDQALAIISDERYVPHSRRRLPPEVTDGRIVYAVSLWIRRALLPDGVLSPEFLVLPCLATPGEQGLIEMMNPAWTME